MRPLTSMTEFEKMVMENRVPPFLITGPCVLENEKITRSIASHVKALSLDLEIPVIFKGSYRKANRTREDAFHGVGIERGLELLKMVKQQYELPVTSDVHELCEVDKAAEVLDIIQIPALLCKNTEILHAVGETEKVVNIKKGYFFTADDMYYAIEKIISHGNSRIMLTERGNLFGYSDMIVDFRCVGKLKSFGYPVIFDASHSVRNISRRSDDPFGGTPEAIPLLTRCAAAAGVDGLFVETHLAPEKAQCDSITSYPLNLLNGLVQNFLELHDIVSRMNIKSPIHSNNYA